MSSQEVTLKPVIEQLLQAHFHIAEQHNPAREPQLVVEARLKGEPDQMFAIKASDLTYGEDGLTINDEFVIIWQGVSQVESELDRLVITLNDASTVIFEAVAP